MPDPVAPTINPCGPEPPCADSLMSRITGSPSPSLPIGTRSSRCSVTSAHRRTMSSVVGVAAEQHLGERDGPGEHLIALVGQAQRSQPAGDQLGQPDRNLVGYTVLHRRRHEGRLALQVQPARLAKPDPQIDSARLVHLPLGQEHQGEAEPRSRGLDQGP